MVAEFARDRSIASYLARRANMFALVRVAEETIAGTIAPLQAAEKIVAFRWRLDGEDLDVFLPFVGVASEMDNCTVGDRSLWAQAFLDECDRNYAETESHYGPWVIESCAPLIAEFKPRLLMCPVCGFIGTDPPYHEDGYPSYDCCACCGFAFDSELVRDDQELFAQFRRRWIRHGMRFREPPSPPAWDPLAQMQTAGLGVVPFDV